MTMPNILLVEDNELNRDMLSRRLERRGYGVWIAIDGAEGIRMARELRPDLILMDIGLPVIDGWEATRRLKTDSETRHIPVIALTAHAMPHDRQKADDIGFEGFETKPVDMPALLGKMVQLLAENSGTVPKTEPSLPANKGDQ
jgi:CheY-like chemotaxis protein